MPCNLKPSRLARFRAIGTILGIAAVVTYCEAVSQYELTSPDGGQVPSPVSDFTANSPTASSVALSFTEVDNGAKKPANYGIRFGKAPMTWSAGTTVTQGPCAAPIMGAAIGRKR